MVATRRRAAERTSVQSDRAGESQRTPEQPHLHAASACSTFRLGLSRSRQSPFASAAPDCGGTRRRHSRRRHRTHAHAARHRKEAVVAPGDPQGGRRRVGRCDSLSHNRRPVGGAARNRSLESTCCWEEPSGASREGPPSLAGRCALSVWVTGAAAGVAGVRFGSRSSPNGAKLAHSASPPPTPTRTGHNNGGMGRSKR